MFSKFKILTIAVGFVSIIAGAQNKMDITPNKYIAYKAIEAIKVDGSDNDVSWSKAKWSQRFIDIEGVKIPKYNTQVKMLWDENYFYILAKMDEPHVWADIKQHDAVIFHNNDFEVFVE